MSPAHGDHFRAWNARIVTLATANPTSQFTPTEVIQNTRRSETDSEAQVPKGAEIHKQCNRDQEPDQVQSKTVGALPLANREPCTLFRSRK